MNFNAIILITKGNRGLEYTYLTHDLNDINGLIDYDPCPIDPEYEFNLPTEKGIYKASLSINYTKEYGTQTTMNTYELIHDLKL